MIRVALFLGEGEEQRKVWALLPGPPPMGVFLTLRDLIPDALPDEPRETQTTYAVVGQHWDVVRSPEELGEVPAGEAVLAAVTVYCRVVTEVADLPEPERGET